MAGDGVTKIIDLKEELTSLHTGTGGGGNTTNITTGEFDKNKTFTRTQKKSKRGMISVLTFQDAVDCRL